MSYEVENVRERPQETPFGDFLGFYRPHPLGLGGDQYHFAFENRYGASVVRFDGTYGGKQGLWELAVLYNEHPEQGTNPRGENFGITYNTKITDDVIGWLDEDAVTELLVEIGRLGQKELTQ